MIDWQVLTETDGAGSVKRSYVYGNYIDEVLVKIEDSDDIFYAHNHLYSPVALIDDQGDVIERYEYDAYGKPYFMEPNFVLLEDQQSDYNNVILFTGRRVDILDNGALVLQYSRNRYYNYHTGRWLTQDTLGVVPDAKNSYLFRTSRQYINGMNLYEYCKSKPFCYKDPFGTDIYLKEGNIHGGIINQLIHQQVCVDLWRMKWREDGSHYWQNYDQECYSFGLTGFGFAYPKRTWLGFDVLNIALPWSFKGKIYVTDWTGGVVKKRKSTTVLQDLDWMIYMWSRVGTKDTYTVDWYNCRKYSQLEFADAPGILSSSSKNTGYSPSSGAESDVSLLSLLILVCMRLLGVLKNILKIKKCYLLSYLNYLNARDMLIVQRMVGGKK